MTKRFKDIEVSADTGEVRLYTTDNDYTEYTSEKLLNLLNKQDQRIQELEERIQELEESLGFCRDLLDGTCNSTRMKQLHETIEDMVKQSTSEVKESIEDE